MIDNLYKTLKSVAHAQRAPQVLNLDFNYAEILNNISPDIISPDIKKRSARVACATFFEVLSLIAPT
ncbi:hypothetical protein FEV09_07550 [Pseudanabaena catenata USMAC16]|uniref:Uncharacterized protein n=2 Tax=Pseudanabaena TaxID=1152 RepID=L8N578_9CYAN|nr:hypothetical protein [Pseudanabaena catenata]ELS33383.1 hypothetical protein Pse7429DRAFT_1521 [Pseudanabaena biceps PCC 7429]MDG3494411.1 hypothetical protein [Pseudanabaena catenata USMAC16]